MAAWFLVAIPAGLVGCGRVFLPRGRVFLPRCFSNLGISAFLVGCHKALEHLGSAPEDPGLVIHSSLVLVLGGPGLLLPQLICIRCLDPGKGVKGPTSGWCVNCSRQAGGCPALGRLSGLLLGDLQQLGGAPQDPGHVQRGKGLKVLAADGVQALP